MELEHKALGVQGQKVLNRETGIVETIVSVTGMQDEVKDIIEPGVYAKTLATRTPKGIWGHDWQSPVAKTLKVEELMPRDARLPAKTSEGKPWPNTAGALLVKTQFNLDTQRGREAYSDVVFFGEDQCWSIGYQVPVGGSQVDSRTGVRTIKAIELFEYSPVLWGAMPSATTYDGTKDLRVRDVQFAYKKLTAGGHAERRQLEAKAVAPMTEIDDNPDMDGDDDSTDDDSTTPTGSAAVLATVVDALQTALDALNVLMGDNPDGPEETKGAGFLKCIKCGSTKADLSGGGAKCANCGTKLVHKVKAVDRNLELKGAGFLKCIKCGSTNADVSGNGAKCANCGTKLVAKANGKSLESIENKAKDPFVASRLADASHTPEDHLAAAAAHQKAGLVAAAADSPTVAAVHHAAMQAHAVAAARTPAPNVSTVGDAVDAAKNPAVDPSADPLADPKDQSPDVVPQGSMGAGKGDNANDPNEGPANNGSSTDEVGDGGEEVDRSDDNAADSASDDMIAPDRDPTDAPDSVSLSTDDAKAVSGVFDGDMDAALGSLPSGDAYADDWDQLNAGLDVLDTALTDQDTVAADVGLYAVENGLTMLATTYANSGNDDAGKLAADLAQWCSDTRDELWNADGDGVTLPDVPSPLAKSSRPKVTADTTAPVKPRDDTAAVKPKTTAPTPIAARGTGKSLGGDSWSFEDKELADVLGLQRL